MMIPSRRLCSCTGNARTSSSRAAMEEGIKGFDTLTASHARGGDNRLLRNILLVIWFESLTFLQRSLRVQSQQQQEELQSVHQREEGEGLALECDVLLEQELQILKELMDSEGPSQDTGAAALPKPGLEGSEGLTEPGAAALPKPGVEGMSPAGDPMAYFRQLVALGPPSEAAQWTPLYIVSTLRETVLQDTLQANLQQLALACQSMVSIKELWDREEVIQEVEAFDLADMETKAEHAAAAEKRTAALPPLLNLTQAQEDLISTAAEAVQGICQDLTQQQQELRTRMPGAAAPGAAAAAGLAGPRTDAAALQSQSTADAAVDRLWGDPAGAASNSYVSQVSASFAGLDYCQGGAEAQQQLAARMKLLTAKETVVKFMLVGFMLGCLSYQQLSQMSVLAWPYPVRLSCLAKAIHQLHQHEQKVDQQDQEAMITEQTQQQLEHEQQRDRDQAASASGS